MDKKFNVKERLFLMVLAMILLLSGCGGSDEGGSPSSTPPPSSSTRPTPDQGGAHAQLERLTLTAYPIETKGTSELTLIIGNEQSFLAVGEYSDGHSKILTEELTVDDWQSSDTELGEFIQSGVLKGKASGEITVSFSQGNLTSNSLEVTVTDAIITDIAITPSAVNLAIGQNQPLVATAIYSNGLSINISDSVKWASDDPSKATITSQNDYGLLKGVNVGTTTVTAMKDGVTSNTVDLEVTNAVITGIHVSPPVVNVARGQNHRLTANAVYSDNTSSDISDSVNWLPLDVSTASVTTSGLLSGVKAGNTTLTAVKDGVTSNTVGVVVSDAVITHINITPPRVSVAKGQNQVLTATAIYSDKTSADISDSVSWRPIDANTTTVTSSGVLSGSNVGATTLIAVKDDVTSNIVDVEVSDAVVTSISVTPPMVTVAKGQNQALTATATYSDNTSSDISDSVTWRSVDASTATVTPEGQVTGIDVGITTVAALKDGLASNEVDVEITNAVMTGLTFDPQAVGVVTGQTQPVAVAATYSDGTSSDVSNSVTWWAPVVDIMSLAADGLVTGLTPGNSQISAAYNGFKHSAEVNVCSADSNGLIGKCIDVFNAGDGKLFTSSPSVAYARNMGLENVNSIYMDTFYLFSFKNAEALCRQYNAKNIAGRSNWRLPTIDELSNDLYSNLPTARGWQLYNSYWSSSVDRNTNRYLVLSLYNNSRSRAYSLNFTSCVSEL